MTLSRKVISVICISFTAFAISACTVVDPLGEYVGDNETVFPSDDVDNRGGHH